MSPVQLDNAVKHHVMACPMTRRSDAGLAD